MQELTTSEIDMISAGPSAITLLALAGQCNPSAPTPALAISGILPAASSVFMSNDPAAIAK